MLVIEKILNADNWADVEYEMYLLSNVHKGIYKCLHSFDEFRPELIL